MSAFSGPQRPGAKRDLKELKRRDAEERNAKTKPENTREYRRVVAAAEEILTGQKKKKGKK